MQILLTSEFSFAQNVQHWIKIAYFFVRSTTKSGEDIPINCEETKESKEPDSELNHNTL